MTKRLYYVDRNLEGEARIAEIRGDGPSQVVLDATLFHPQGGGQQADGGILGDYPVRDVRKDENGDIVHVIDSVGKLQMGDIVAFAVDRSARQRNARLHTAGHLIAGVCERMYPGVRAVGGHHWSGEARVDFDAGTEPVTVDANAVMAALDEAVARALPVIQSSGEPAPRNVTIEGFSPVSCGGTHVRHLGELGHVEIRKIRAKGDRIRVSYDVIHVRGEEPEGNILH